MSKGLWIVLIVILGGLTLWVVNIVTNATQSSEADYYILKDTTEAAMIDAIDLAYYRVKGEIRINREIFVESFLRRFAESVTEVKNYDIQFRGVLEMPPKVTISLGDKTTATFDGDTIDIQNKIDAILETPYECKGAILPNGKTLECE